MQVNTPVTALRGVGPARAQQLARLGVTTVGELLALLPRRYQDLTGGIPLAQARHGDTVAFRGRFAPGSHRPYFPRKNFSVLQARLTGEQGSVLCQWYNQPWIGSQLTGDEVIAIGTVDARSGASRLINPVLESGAGLSLPVLPVYPLTQGLSQRNLRQWMEQALEACPCPEDLPPRVVEALALPPRELALAHCHFPPDMAAARAARRRMTAESFLLYGSLLRRRRLSADRRGNGFPIPADPHLEVFLRSLPYHPTGAQSRVIGEICGDLVGDRPMNRLVQGDVGSGKTLVAMAALFLAARAGYQGALMAPTEVLARQLFAQAQELLAPLGVRVGLMISGMGAAPLQAARQQVSAGQWDVTVGTHALIQDRVQFRRLALVVTDEQHRFGVSQRAALLEKGEAPHMLVMSATPLPRTLGLLLFSDLDLSAVDELPPGRKPIKTRCISGSRREDMYRYLAARAREGEQAYVVCPAIEDSEEGDLRSVESLSQELGAGPLARTPMAVLHGRMSAEEKERALEAFRTGRVSVLIATTVIEVGINVPNATAMVIEDAHRFGLAQLHQLRGRVGRGDKESYCFLVSDHEGEDARRRLSLLASCQDGFRLAEEDMRLRGPGEFLGTRQAGLDGQVALLMEHPQLAQQVMTLLDGIFSDPALAGEREALLAAADARYGSLAASIVMN